MIYRKRLHKSNYSLGFTKGNQFIKLELGKRVWYFSYGMPVFWTLTDIREYRDWIGGYTMVTHLARKERVSVDRLVDATDNNVERLLMQAMR